MSTTLPEFNEADPKFYSIFYNETTLYDRKEWKKFLLSLQKLCLQSIAPLIYDNSLTELLKEDVKIQNAIQYVVQYLKGEKSKEEFKTDVDKLIEKPFLSRADAYDIFHMIGFGILLVPALMAVMYFPAGLSLGIVFGAVALTGLNVLFADLALVGICLAISAIKMCFESESDYQKGAEISDKLHKIMLEVAPDNVSKDTPLSPKP